MTDCALCDSEFPITEGGIVEGMRFCGPHYEEVKE